MGSQEKSALGRDGARRIVSNMSEAVSYLIGVARSAGMDDVARKLNDVNNQLRELEHIELRVTLDADKEEQLERQGALKH